jgi:hypothetical protein
MTSPPSWAAAGRMRVSISSLILAVTSSSSPGESAPGAEDRGLENLPILFLALLDDD